MLVAESFLRTLIKIYGKHAVYSGGESWYPEACTYLGLEHLLHTSFARWVSLLIVVFLVPAKFIPKMFLSICLVSLKRNERNAK
jgi:hypothetical protein